MDIPNPLIIAVIILNRIILSGVLWKLVDFARGYGRFEQRVDFTEAEIRHIRFTEFWQPALE